MRYLLLLFVVVPLAELYLLLWVSQHIGFWPTVGITLLTGVIGGTLAKQQGLRALRGWNQALTEFQVPEAGLLDGALILVGGALLITPGVATDALGFALLLPITRRPIARWLKSLVNQYVSSHSVHSEIKTEPFRSQHQVIDTDGRSSD